MSADEPLAHDSHYAPQSYLRRFSPANDNYVHAYRTLVPREGMKLWDYKSARGIAVRRDLYTSVAADKESDRIEKWLNDEIENPAQAVLDRLTRRTPLSPLDRKKLARYIASLDARSPIYYSQHTQMMATHIEGVLRDTMERTLKDLTDARRKGEPFPVVPHGYEFSHSIAVKLDRGTPGADNASLNVNVVVGREYWLDSIRHVVDDLSVLLENHDWRVIRPHDGWTWYTSDYPVVRLNFHHSGEYNFNGGFGSTGTDILLPLSPSDMLMAQVGKPTTITQFNIDQTYLIKRIIAEHAYRWIVAAHPVQHAAWFRRRVVDLAQYKAEETGWARYHDEQSQAILELHRQEKEDRERAS